MAGGAAMWMRAEPRRGAPGRQHDTGHTVIDTIADAASILASHCGRSAGRLGR
jgi:hypothetical protein